VLPRVGEKKADAFGPTDPLAGDWLSSSGSVGISGQVEEVKGRECEAEAEEVEWWRACV
jgi:hypothetical protein